MKSPMTQATYTVHIPGFRISFCWDSL